MAPLTKDSVEVTNSGTQTAVPQAGALPKQASAGGGHLRADALSLEVPVKVHGSRVTEVARGVAPRTEPFEEQTSTMIVFPQGAVLRMSTAVSASQMLVVTNLKTRQDAICRVIKVRTFSNMQGYVEVEFTHKQPGYWGVNFPSEGPAPSNQAAPAIPAVTPIAVPESPVKTSAIQNVSPTPATLPSTVAPAPPLAPVAAPPPLASAPAAFTPVTPTSVAPASVPPSKPESNFAPIGTQEEVQPAASATTPVAVKFVAPVRPIPSAPVSASTPAHTERVHEKIVPEIPKPSIAAQALAEANIDITAEPAAPSTLSLNEVRGDESAATGVLAADAGLAAAEEQDEASAPAASLTGSGHGTFGSFSGGAALGSGRAASADGFGARLDGSLETSDSHTSQPRGNNWMLIAACVAVLFVGVFGGVFYFRSQSANSTNSSAPKANSPAVPQSLAFQSPSAISDQPSPSALAHNSATNPIAIVTQSSAPAATVSASSSASGSGPRVVERQNSKITDDMVRQQLDVHPVAPQRSGAGQTDAAPAVDAAPAADSSGTGALSGIISPNVAAPAAPEIRPDTDGPVKVGGNVKEPHLVSRAMPEYPLVAKEAGIQGDVVMKTTIDAKGNVVNVQVVSGPQMLRGPAMAALRRWRYEPSTLNGQPIAVQMLVTIKFSR
ncbi:MAG TPA: TonB family protein [Candidatus Acidoferrales bacterium]|jgi:TonB family protein|nr:TonB family protein [Candidatus Acidoferrales bacterium]